MEKSNYNNCSRPSEFGECDLRAGDAHLSESPSKVYDFDEAQAPLALLGNILPPSTESLFQTLIYAYN
jgi:hypothetical protein